MSFTFKVGSEGKPSAGDTLKVFDSSSAELVSDLFNPLNEKALANPIIVPSTCVYFAIDTYAQKPIDVYWYEGDEMLLVRHVTTGLFV